jgi:coenzyme F420-reducing hydrogenase alpha subunit
MSVERERLYAGVVRIAAGLAGGRVATVAVRSERPRGLGAELARHPPAAIPDLARRLFALCGVSQAMAARCALDMAGASVASPSPTAIVQSLAAERVTAHLQATYIDWSAAVPPTPAEAAAIPRALAAAQNPDGGGDALCDIVAGLGMSAAPRAGSWGHRLLAAAGDDGTGQPACDPLGPADDARVLAALDHQGEAFAAAPSLPGRRPQTGPAARAARRGLTARSPAGRLGARLAEIAEAACVLTGAQLADPAEWIVAGRLAPGTGFCAIETPRGRLHHLVRLGPQGAVLRYLILAPTEWNFAADGPFATALNGLHLKPDAARPAIERLASLYDPCVGCTIEVHQLDR